MKKFVFFVVCLCLLLLPNISNSQALYEYWQTTDTVITVLWDQPADWKAGDQYEVKRIMVEAPTMEIPIITVSTFSVNLPSIRAGHYEVQIRVKRGSSYSVWASCTDPLKATVNGVPSGWRIYWYLAPPGPIIIGQLEDANLFGGNEYGFSERKSSVLGGQSVTRRSWL
jgi:hypothetical protein